MPSRTALYSAVGRDVTRYELDILQAPGTAHMSRLFTRLGAKPARTTPAQFAALMKFELAKWTKVAQESGATAD